MSQDQERTQPRDGARAPDFELEGLDGRKFRSRDLLKEGPILLTFYRGAWCGCCQADLRDVMSVMPRLQEGNLTVLGVFHGMSPEAGALINEEYGLDFPIVNDVDGRVAEAFGIRRTAAEFEAIQQELGPEMLALKGGEPWILPMQARFLIGADGVIVRSDINSSYEDRCALRELMPSIESLA